MFSLILLLLQLLLIQIVLNGYVETSSIVFCNDINDDDDINNDNILCVGEYTISTPSPTMNNNNNKNSNDQTIEFVGGWSLAL